MAHFEIAECPVCGREAYGMKEIDRIFGYRYNGTRPQSWCKKCISLPKTCGYTDCQFWGDDYPRCYYSPKCPTNGD